MAISCKPADLVRAAKCFPCVPKQARRWVKAYLLCQGVNKPGGFFGIPTPTGFTFLPSDTTGVTVVASWNAPPSGITATEVWTSTDNITYALAATVAGPGTTAALTYSSTVHVLNYCKIRWKTATSQSAFTSPIFIPSEVPVWIKAVITNGGAAVAQATCLAVNTFAIALVNAGADASMISVTVFAPDNLTAARTPLYKTSGNDPWTNSGFVAGDLTVNGVKGDGVKFLDTGVVCNTVFNSGANSSAGLSTYIPTASTLGSVDFCGVETFPNVCLFIRNNLGGPPSTTTEFACWNQNAGQGLTSGAIAAWVGFTSGSRTTATRADLYVGSSTQAFTNLANDLNNQLGAALTTQSIICWGWKIAGVGSAHSDARISFAAIHFGLTSAQTQALFNAVQALRVAFGGGFV